MHIGIDDTDSTKSGCTTYIAALLVEKLIKLKTEFTDYPNLIRLNPNVPWKTRGNGALCLRFNYEQELVDTIKETALDILETNADLEAKGTDPGIVFLNKSNIPKEITAFAKKAMTSIVTLNEAVRLITKYKAEAMGYNKCRGVIGALAAIGENLHGDHTYELIAYRTLENRGTKRRIDKNSIINMDQQTQPCTFNNVDYEKKRVIITPRGPDPIFFGIRGETPEIVKEAYHLLKPQETVERWLVFRSNQGTDAHLAEAGALSAIQPYSSIIAKGTVSRKPTKIPLRHTIFSIKDETAEVDCAAFEPTGTLRKIAEQLVVGDVIEIYGAVRKRLKTERLTVNLEKINIITLSPKVVYRNPICSACGKRLESMGKDKGYRCKKCGTKYRKAEKTGSIEERNLNLGLYISSTGSQRHLTKPFRRYGQEKKRMEESNLIEGWHS